MKNLLLAITILFLVGCAKSPEIGKTYRVTSGFFKGCVGIAVDSYTVFFTQHTMLKNMECRNVYGGIEFFENDELEEVQ